MSKYKRQIILVLSSVFFIFLWFRLVDFRQAIGLIKQTRWLLIVLAIFFGLIYSLFSIWRLKVLLAIFGNISFWYLWLASWFSGLISLIFAFSLGGFGFAYLIAQKGKISYKKAFAILLVDYLIGIFLTFFFGAIALVYFGQKKLLSIKPELGSIFFIGGLLIILAIFLILLLRKKSGLVKKSAAKLKSFLALFLSLRSVWGSVAILTLLMILIGFFQSYLFFVAFRMKPAILPLFLTGSLLGILNLLPGVPGKIGQYETFAVLTYPYLLGLDKEAVFAAFLLQHLISLSLTFVFGGAALYFLKLNLSLIRKQGLKAR